MFKNRMFLFYWISIYKFDEKKFKRGIEDYLFIEANEVL